MASQHSLHFSNSFAISCGTVTLELTKSKVLIIYWRKTGEYFLPKGRKDIAETLEQAALRETFEETGHRVELLPLRIPTLATTPASVSAKKGEDKLVTEPVAVAQRVTKEGILKIIFWYVASGNSVEEQEKGTQKENEEFDTVWVPVEDVVKTLSFDDDRQIAEKALLGAKSLFVENKRSQCAPQGRMEL